MKEMVSQHRVMILCA